MSRCRYVRWWAGVGRYQRGEVNQDGKEGNDDDEGDEGRQRIGLDWIGLD